MQTGMGKTRSIQAARLLLDRYPVSLLISIGFAGGLVENLTAGDVILCQAFVDGNTGTTRLASQFSPRLDLALIPAGKSRGLVISQGVCATIDHLAATAQEKRELGERFKAQVVDLESYWLAETAAQCGLPFIGIRVISDAIHERLPVLENALNSNGKVRFFSVIQHSFAVPGDIFGLMRVFRNSLRAGEKLNLVLKELIPLLERSDDAGRNR